MSARFGVARARPPGRCFGWVVACLIFLARGAEAQSVAGWRDANKARQPLKNTEPEAELAPLLRGDELRAKLPDLETDPDPATLWMTPFMAVRFPFQMLGAGAALDLYPVPWLSSRLAYSFGITPTAELSVEPSHYAEAFVGVRVFRVLGERATDIRLKTHVYEWAVKAGIPTSHAVYLDAGILSGFMALNRCTNCAASPTERTFEIDPRQLILPAAGLRYLYGFSYRSKQRNLREDFVLQVYLQLILAPFNAPDHQLFNATKRPLNEPSFGGRIGLEIPPIGGCIFKLLFGTGCAQGRLAVGYIPVALPLLFEAQLEFPFYVR